MEITHFDDDPRVARVKFRVFVEIDPALLDTEASEPVWDGVLRASSIPEVGGYVVVVHGEVLVDPPMPGETLWARQPEVYWVP
jgi:hypothetical protein